MSTDPGDRPRGSTAGLLFLTVWPWASSLTFLGLAFPICKMGMEMVFTLQDCHEDETTSHSGARDASCHLSPTPSQRSDTICYTQSLRGPRSGVFQGLHGVGLGHIKYPTQREGTKRTQSPSAHRIPGWARAEMRTVCSGPVLAILKRTGKLLSMFSGFIYYTINADPFFASQEFCDKSVLGFSIIVKGGKEAREQGY